MDIQKVFDKVANRELAYAYIIKKVAKMPLKKDREKTATDLVAHLQKEQDEIKDHKIYNVNCPECKSPIDDETGLCINCA